MTPTPPDGMDADLQRATALARLLGRRRFNELLDVLELRLLNVLSFAGDPAQHQAAITMLVHQSRGSAGSLGLHGLMAVLKGVEDALPAPTDHPAWRSADRQSRIAADLRRTVDCLSAGRRLLEASIPDLAAGS